MCECPGCAEEQRRDGTPTKRIIVIKDGKEKYEWVEDKKVR